MAPRGIRSGIHGETANRASGGSRVIDTWHCSLVFFSVYIVSYIKKYIRPTRILGSCLFDFLGNWFHSCASTGGPIELYILHIIPPYQPGQRKRNNIINSNKSNLCNTSVIIISIYQCADCKLPRLNPEIKRETCPTATISNSNSSKT